MTNLRLKNTILTLFLGLGIIVFYQNCGNPKVLNSTSGSSLIGTTQTKLIVAFGDSLTRGANPKNPSNTGVKGYVPHLQNAMGYNAEILNCGVGGETTFDAMVRYSQIINGDYRNCTRDTVDTSSTAAFYDYSEYQGKKPDHILFWMGTNDVLKNIPNQFDSFNNLKWYIDNAKQKNIEITLSTIPPYGNVNGYTPMIVTQNGVSLDRVKTFNALVEQAAGDYEDVLVVNTYESLASNFQNYTWDQIHLNSTAYQIIANLWEDALKYKIAKVPFSVSGKLACSTASGYQIPSGVAVCSCASGNLGSLSLCNNGQYVSLFNVNQSCKNTSENHGFITHHCK